MPYFMYMPIRATSWNAALLPGGTHTNPVSWCRKRAQVVVLCSHHDFVTVVESRGTAADLSHLPTTHEWRGTFRATRPGEATSHAGGVVIGVHRCFERMGCRISHVVATGRVLVATVYDAERPII